MLIFHNAQIVNEGRVFTGFVAVEGAEIVAVGAGDVPATMTADERTALHDCHGAYLMPGAIDTHVHFREPGLEHKATIASESRAAVAGGVTSFIDMPNTVPPTVTVEAWEDKMARAARTSMANYAFFLGATPDNIDILRTADYSQVAGVKVFMGSTTGGMLMDEQDHLERVFAEVPALIAVHAEDEQMLRRKRQERLDYLATRADLETLPYIHHSYMRDGICAPAIRRAVKLAKKHGARLHITHLSDPASAEALKDADGNYASSVPTRDKQITVETCPHYLLLGLSDYDRLEWRMKCNPAIVLERKRNRARHDGLDVLRQMLLSGLIDTVATDHAPHLVEEKVGHALKGASGMPGVQFSVPLMWDLLGPVTAVQKMSHGPADAFKIRARGYLRPGYAADIAIVERLAEPHVITDDDVLSPCGWTPWVGREVNWRVTGTMVNGRWVWSDGEICSLLPHGRPLRFDPR